MNWTLVQCEDCGQPYAARLNEAGFCLPTESGACPCGNDGFVEVESGTSNGDSVTESD